MGISRAMTSAASVLTSVALAASLCHPASAGSLAHTVTLKDHLGTQWSNELVHESLTFPAGQVAAPTAKVTRSDGVVLGSQVTDVRRYDDGTIRSMNVWFFANVPPNGSASYAITPGVKPSVAGGVSITVTKSHITLTTNAPKPIGLRLLAGAHNFDWPVPMEGRFAPIQALLLPSGRQIGKARFDVPFRLKSYESEVMAAGPLFVDVTIRYLLEVGYWTFKARVIDGCSMIQIEEEFNTGHSGLGAKEFDRYYSLVLNTGGFKPTQGWYSDNSQNPKFHDLGERLIPKSWEATGALPRGGWIASPVNGYTLTFDEDRNDYFLTGWPSVIPQIGSFIRFLEPNGDAIGFANLHIMGWRDAEAIRFRTTRAGELLVNLPVQKFTQDWNTDGFTDGSPNYTGKTLFVPANTCRRSYGIMLTEAEDEKASRLGSLSGMTARLAAQPLDQVKDWVLDWPDPLADEKWADEPTPAGAKALKLMRGRMEVARLGGNLVSYSMGNHYHFSKAVFPVIEKVINDPTQLTAAQRKELRSLVAFEAYRQNSPELFPYGTGVHLNNPNMTIMAVEARTKSALLIKDHPRFKDWGKTTFGLMQDFFRRFTKPSGAPYENPHYTIGVTLDWSAIANEALIEAGIGDAFDNERFRRCMQFVLNWLTPPDPRFNGYRVLLPIGNCSYQSVPPTFAQRLVSYYQKRDPVLAGQLQWFANQTLPDAKKVSVVEDVRPELGSVWYRDYGVFFRHGYGTPYESLLHFLAGSCFGHCEIETDQMTYTLYAKGQPIHLHFGNGYFPIYNRPWLRNRISFDMKMEMPERNKVDVEFASFTPEVEYLRAVRETDRLLERGTEYPLLDKKGMRWTPEESKSWGKAMTSDPERIPMTIWHRQMLFLKDANPKGPNYFVMRDAFSGLPTKPTDLNLWFLANTMTEDGDVYHFDGQCEVDMDVFVNTPPPGTFEPKTGKYGHVQQPYGRFTGFDPKCHPGGKRREDQLLLRIRQPAGKSYLVVLYPRLKKGEPAAVFTRLTDSAVKVETPLATDCAFLSPWPVSFADDKLKFTGMAGAVRFYKTGRIAIVGSEGKTEVSVSGKVISGQGAFVVTVDGAQVVSKTFSEDAKVTVR